MSKKNVRQGFQLFSRKVVRIIRKSMVHEDFRTEHKKRPQAFTRDRKLTFDRMIGIMLRKGSKSNQLTLNEFFGPLFKSIQNKIMTVTSSAFTQAREGLSHTAFIALNKDSILSNYYDENQNTYERWNGFRLFAVDGSTLRIPNNPEIRETFGVVGNKNQIGKQLPHTEAKLSCLYDVCNNIAVDSLLYPARTGERDMAIEHIHNFSLNEKDIVIFDRGYGGYGLFAAVLEQGANFVCRVRNSMKDTRELFEKDCQIDSKVVILVPNDKSPPKMKEYAKRFGIIFPKEITIRFVRVILSTGEIEVLATSLIDESKYQTEIFKDLYFQRWGIETYYGTLKNRLSLENFTGKTSESVKQDVFSAIFVSNLETVFTRDANEELKRKCKTKELKNDQQVNKQVSFNAIKNAVLDIFFDENIPEKEIFERLNILFQLNPTAKRKDREVERKKVYHWKRIQYYKRRKKQCF